MANLVVGASLVAQLVKNLPAPCRRPKLDAGSIPGWGRSPGEGNGCPFQYSCLENPMDWGLSGSPVYGILQARVLEWVAIPFFRGSFPPRD